MTKPQSEADSFNALLLQSQPCGYDRKILCEIPLEMQYQAAVRVEKNPYKAVYEVVVYTPKKEAKND